MAEALELPAHRREAFLLEACEDEALRRRVLSALAASLDEFLEAPAIDGLETAPGATDVESPDHVGPFRVLSLLGRGGMGEVYLAEQKEPVERRVALKILPRHFGLEELRARFEAERQALARLSHRHIAQLYEAGTTSDGRPYFAMEWIDGETITDFCHRRSLSVEARLELFLDVCSGIQHAHGKGLIHRDLKPANILVTNDGEAKIVDFGIAKSLDQPLAAGLPITGDHVVGTPGYLAPEAFREGPDRLLDTRADIYSLGVVLYELLIGRGPFELAGLSLPEIAERLTRDVAPSLSGRLRSLDETERAAQAESMGLTPAQLSRRLDGDLSWVAARAVDDQPARRYGTVAELAADIRRHLEHRPVLAGPVSTGYRLRKLVRRHRVAATAALTVVLALLLAVGGLSLGLLSSQRSERRAEEQAQLARVEAENARRALAETEQMTAFLRQLFLEANPRTHAGEVPTAIDLLDAGAERIETSFPDQPLTRMRFLHVIGEMFGEMGRYDRAVGLLEQAVHIGDEIFPEPAKFTPVIDSLGLAYLRLGQFDEGRVQLERAVKLGRGRADLKNASAAPDSEAEAAKQLASSLQGLGMALHALRRHDEAWQHYEEALALREGSFGPEEPTVAITLNSLGALAVNRGELERAADLHRRALAIREAGLKPYHPDIADSLGNLGQVLRRMGQLEEAEELYRRSLEIRQRAYPPDHPRLVSTRQNLAIVYAEMKRFDEAEPLFRETLESLERIYGPEHLRVAQALNNLGLFFVEQKKARQAEPLLRRALDLRLELLGPTHQNIGSTQHNLGLVALELGRLTEADQRITEALRIFEQELSPTARRTVPVRLSLAKLRRQQGRTAEAEEQLRLGLEIVEDASDPYWGELDSEMQALNRGEVSLEVE